MVYKLDYSVIEDIEAMLKSELGQGNEVSLESLLWSIDARHRVIADEREINEALKWVKLYKIKRTPSSVIFVACNEAGTDLITKKDVKLGVHLYNKSVSEQP